MFLQDLILHRLRQGIRRRLSRTDRRPPCRRGTEARSAWTPPAAPTGAATCVTVCPTEAVARIEGGAVRLDLGRCVFCSACVEACPARSHHPYRRPPHGRAPREDLVLGAPAPGVALAEALDDKLLQALRSLAAPASGERRRVQRLRGGHQRAGHRRSGTSAASASSSWPPPATRTDC